MSDPMEKRWQQVWALFEKVDEQIAETGRQIRELWEHSKQVDEQIAETGRQIRELWEHSKQVDQKFAETAERMQQLQEQIEESQRRMEESQRRMERQWERDRQELRKLYARLTSRWGRFVENLIAGGVLQALRAWGIDVSRTAQRVRGICNGKRMEVDVLAVGREQVVVVEVKSEVSVEDIRRFVGKLEEFREFFPEYRGYRIYGAIGGLEFLEESDRYAYRQGLFVLAPKGEERVEIRNDADFQPRCF